MPSSLQITSPAAAWARIDRELLDFPKELRAAKFQAVKKTSDQGRNLIFNRFKQQYPNVQKSKIESGDLTQRKRPIVSSVEGGSENPQGKISVRDYRIPVIAFKPTGPGAKIPTLGRPGGVTVQINQKDTFRHAFMARMKSGHVGIFLRGRGKRQSMAQAAQGAAVKMTSNFAGRFPIREMMGPSIYSLMDVPAVNTEVIGQLDDLLARNIESQLVFRRAKVGIL